MTFLVGIVILPLRNAQTRGSQTRIRKMSWYFKSPVDTRTGRSVQEPATRCRHRPALNPIRPHNPLQDGGPHEPSSRLPARSNESSPQASDRSGQIGQVISQSSQDGVLERAVHDDAAVSRQVGQ